MNALRAEGLALPAVRHGFFTREGGVSAGLFASLNCSMGSGDDRAKVMENRARALDAMGLAPDRLVTGYQVHGRDVAVVTEPWRHEDRPRVDALVTRAPGLALGILTADCAPLLFADPSVPIIAVAHAGWRGAVGGVAEAALLMLEREGGRRERTVAAIGPCIGGRSYEVGPEFLAPFLVESAENARFFAPGAKPSHSLFALGAYLEAKLRGLGLFRVERIDADTCADAARFFSYRRACLAGEKQFGHLLSAIALVP